MKPDHLEQPDSPPDADTMWVSEADEPSLAPEPVHSFLQPDAESELNIAERTKISPLEAEFEIVPVGAGQGNALDLFPPEDVAHDWSLADTDNRAAMVLDEWTAAETPGSWPAIETQTARQSSPFTAAAPVGRARRPAVALRYAAALLALTLVPWFFFTGRLDLIDRGRELLTTARRVTVQAGPPLATLQPRANTPDTLESRTPAWLVTAMAVPPLLPVLVASATPEAVAHVNESDVVPPQVVDVGSAPDARAAAIERNAIAQSRDVPAPPPPAAPLPSETPTPNALVSLRAPTTAAATREPVPPLASAPASSGSGEPAAVPLPARTSDAITAGAAVDIQTTLTRYRHAFSGLDADAVTQVWPSADSSGLRRAFRGLQEQDLSFDDCDVRIAGNSAEAVCQGTVRYVAKVGSKTPRVHRGQWRFNLQHLADAWVIAKVESK